MNGSGTRLEQELALLCNKLRAYRCELGLTQEELARQLGVSVTTVSALERGSKPSPRLVLLVCDVLKLHFREMFFFTQG